MSLPKLFCSLLAVLSLAGCGVPGGEASGTFSSTATLMAINAVGMKVVQPLPAVGCSGSAIPPDRIVELLAAFPEQQRVILAQVLDASAIAWTIQLYAGEFGLGLCFPVENTLILIPGQWSVPSQFTS